MSSRTHLLTGVFANDADLPYTSIPISCYLVTPGGLDVLDLDGRILSNGTRYGVGTVSDAVTGAFSLTAVYVGDLTAADGSAVNCQLVVVGNGRMVESPYAGYSYASSIAIAAWLPSASTSGTLMMGLGADNVADAALQNLGLAIDISVSAVKPDGRTIFAGNPLQVATDASGNIAVPLVPTSLLDPAGARYKITLPGETWYFHVPVHPTGYQGAYDAGTAYDPHSGTFASPADVVLSGGILYQSIQAGTGHTPASSPTYWQVWAYEPIVWNRDEVAVTGATVITTGNLAPSGNIALEPLDPFQSITTFDQQLGNLNKRSIYGDLRVRLVTANFAASAIDDVILLDCTAGNINGTLPTAIGQSKPITFMKIDTTGNAAQLSPVVGGQTIDGGTALVINAANAGATLISDQANYWSPQAASSGGGGGGGGGGGSSSSANLQLDPTTADGQLWGRSYHLVTAEAIGCIGDSLTVSLIQVGSTTSYNPASPTAPATMAVALSTSTLAVSAVNQGVGGTKVGDWAPGSSNLTGAYAAFAAAGVRFVSLMLGTNDALQGETAATYGAGLKAIVNDVVSHGYVPVLHYAPAVQTGPTANALLVAYQPYIDALVNGSTVLAGDKTAYGTFLATPAFYGADNFHLTQAGYNALGALWSTALFIVVQAAGGPQSRSAIALGAGLHLAGGVLSATTVTTASVPLTIAGGASPTFVTTSAGDLVACVFTY